MRSLLGWAIAVALCAACAASATAHGGRVWVSRPDAGPQRGETEGVPVELVYSGERTAVTGRVAGLGARTRIVLQGRAEAGPWRTLAAAGVRGSRVLAHLVPAPEPRWASIRLAALDRRGSLLYAGRPVRLIVAQPPIRCLPPQIPSLPAGEGAIVGGVIIAGGPFPGIEDCSAAPGTTVTLEDPQGATVATQTVSGRQSYVFVVPPGSYSLSSRASPPRCSGSAVVTAGQVTHADAVCPVP